MLLYLDNKTYKKAKFPIIHVKKFFLLTIGIFFAIQM